MKGKVTMDNNQFNFEEAMARLNQISEILESDNVPIDEALNLFEEGLDLSKKLQDVLEGYEEKVKTLVAKHQKDDQNENV